MGISLRIGLGLTMDHNIDWMNEHRLGGDLPVFAAEFNNPVGAGQYFNVTKKPFSDLMSESGTSLEVDGIHVGVGNTLTIGPVPSGVELFSAFDTLGVGWTDAGGGVYSCSGIQGGNSNASEASILVIERTVRVVFTVSDYSAGTITPFAGSNGTGTARSANGTYTEDIVVSVNTTMYFQANIDFTGSISNISVQELVPFVGFNPDEMTVVFVGKWAHNGAADAYILAGGSNTSFIHQSSAVTDDVRATDGTASLDTGSVFADSTDIAVVMSWKKGGSFNILADGSVEDTAPLTGDLYTSEIDVGQLAGASGAIDFVARRILFYATQFDEATRQTVEV